MSAPLYDVSERLQSFLSLEDELDAETFADTLESLEGELHAKIEGVAKYILNLNAEAEMVDNEVVRLRDRGEAITNHATRLKSYLLLHMQRTGTAKVKTPLVSVRIGAGRERIVIDDESKVPDEFCKVVREVRKKDVKDHLASGNPIPGAHLETGPDFLVIS